MRTLGPSLDLWHILLEVFYPMPLQGRIASMGVFANLAGGYDKIGFRCKDVYNYVVHQRK